MTPTLYIPHGGGPCFFMDWSPADMWDEMGAYLKRLPADVGEKPKALLIVSAHWEEAEFTVQTKPNPGLLFDYYGFPPHTYELSWPAPGAPELAARVQALAAAAGIAVRADAQRDFDHGVFIPMLLAWPEADIPTFQLSLKAGLDPAAHLALGRALAPLREEGVLIIGSGMSYHNLRRLMQRDMNGDMRHASHDFDQWLQEAVQGDRDALLRWTEAPNARLCHPREEHLLPLMVAAGAGADDPARMTYHEDSLGPTGAAISAFQFG
ncbi:MAG: DODA-type extradiol aromatic ring-opening family dioxygenase [Asticcacaulis sp.]|uniref:DODA-type extradiol aromatic ring-opening family dioxygenase n=1 Tax=Asticcacaulis sp. TaxID=1872648 RepID=UPI003F7B4E0C